MSTSVQRQNTRRSALSDNADRELVFLPEDQLELELVPGEIGRLERAGLAERIGPVR